MTDQTSEGIGPATAEHWQERAVERSLSASRTKAMQRSARFLAVAVELMNESGGFDFTVQELIDRSGLSLRAFYQHFGGKDELLLALFEEQLDRFLQRLRQDIEGIDDPEERLETFIRQFLVRVKHSPDVGGRTGRALTEYHFRLAATTPQSYANAIQPQVLTLTSLVEAGIGAGAFRTDISARSMALLINTTLVSIAQMGIFHVGDGKPLTDDEIIHWCRSAVTGGAGGSGGSGLIGARKRARVRR